MVSNKQYIAQLGGQVLELTTICIDHTSGTAYTWSVYCLLLLTHTFVCHKGKSNVYYTGQSHRDVEFQCDKWSLHKPKHQFNIKVFERLLLPTESNIKPKNFMVV